MSRSVIITGASGLLGRAILGVFEDASWKTVGTGLTRLDPPRVVKCDVQDEKAVVQLIEQVKPDVLVHSAADRSPDSCTRDPTAAHALNVTATGTLARLCSQHGIFLIYISTDYVFSGTKGEAPYQATHVVNPSNIYGRTKADGEQQVLKHTKPGEAIILRVPVLYGETRPKENNKESAVNVLLDSLWKSQEETVVVDDYALRYPTNTADVARVCRDVAELYLAKRPETQILQFSSEDRMTKFEIVKTLAEVMGLSVENVVADRESGKKPDKDGTLRPYDCHLSTTELKELGVDVSTVDFAVWWRRWVGAFRH